MKKLGLLLSVMFLMLLLPITRVEAAEIVDFGECGDNVTWTLDEEGTLVISGEGEMWDYGDYQWYPEKSAPWYELRMQIVAVVLEEGVTRIGSYAFQSCNNMLSIAMPTSITTIGDGAFKYAGLTEFSIPEGFTCIEEETFYGCKLEKITIPSSVKTIGAHALSRCSNLKNVVIPEGVQTLEMCAFYDSGIQSVNIPSSVSTMGDSVFEGCSNLTNVEIAYGIKRIGKSAFHFCENLKVIMFPSSVTTIGASAFYRAGLENVYIPSSVKTIERYAFYSCDSLDKLAIPSSVTSIGDAALYFGKTSYKRECGTIVINKGSYAEEYAKQINSEGSYSIDYEIVSGNIYGAALNFGQDIEDATTNDLDNANPNHVLKKAIYVENSPLTKDREYNLINTYKKVTLAWINDICDIKTVMLNCAVVNDEESVKEYALYQGEKKLTSSINGELTVQLDEECKGDGYYVIVVSSDGKRTKTALHLDVAVVESDKSQKINLGGKSGLEFGIPAEIPFLGGGKISFNELPFPVYIALGDDGTARVGVNIKKDLLKDEATYPSFKDSWNKLEENYKKAGKFLEKDVKQLRNLLESESKLGAFGSASLNFMFGAFGEGKVDENGNVIVTLNYMVSVSGSGTWGMQVMFFSVPVVIEATAGIEGELKGEMTGIWSNEDGLKERDADLVLKIAGKISVFGGVGIKSVAAIGAYGSGKITSDIVLLSTKRESGLESCDITLEAGLKGYVWSFKGELPLASNTWNLYARPDTQTASSGENVDTLDDLVLMSLYNEELYQVSEEDVTNYTSTFTDNQGTIGIVIEDAFISSQPTVASTEDYVILTYLATDAERSAVNSIVLMYTVYDKASGVWAEPKQVDTNGTMDWTAIMDSDGENIRLVYMQQSELLQDSIDISDLTVGMKITTAVFNSETKEFSEFEDVAVSNQKEYVSRPKVTTASGSAMVCWVQGPTGDYFGTNSLNSVYCRELSDGSWSEPLLVAENLNCITELSMGVINGEKVVAYIVDTDNNLDSYNDRIITVVNENGIEKQVASGEVANIDFKILPGKTEAALIWYSEGNIGYLPKFEDEAATLFAVNDEGNLENTVGSDFEIVGDKIIFSHSYLDGNSGIYSLSYENNSYSEAVSVPTTQGVINDFSADESMVVWLDTEAITSEDGIEDYSVIGYCMYNEQYDIQVLYTDILWEEIVPGETATLTVGLGNNTDAMLSDVNIMLLDQNQNFVFEFMAECEIPSGAEGEAEVTFTVPASLENAIYTVVVNGTKTDTVPGNNLLELKLCYTDFTVEAKEIICEEKAYLMAEITNAGYIDSGATITFCDTEGKILYSEVISNIPPQDDYIVVVSEDVLFADETMSESIVYIEVISNKEEHDTSNNRISEYMVLCSNEIPYVSIVFKDGETELSNTVYEVGANITPDTLPTDAFGWYELGDETKTIVTDFTSITTDKVYVAKKNSTLKFSGASLTLSSDISVKYEVKEELFAESGYTNPYVVFEFNDKEIIVSEYTVKDGKYIFAFTDIAPKQINDMIYATLYAELDGQEVASATREYSVATYCYNMLAKCVGNDAYTSFCTLLVDLLNYGAAAQVYFDYNTNALVTEKLTTEQIALGTQETPTLEDILDRAYVTVDSPLVTWKGAGLRLEEAVTIRFKIATDDLNGLVMKVESESGEIWNIPAGDFVVTDGGYFVFFDGLRASKMSEPVYATVYKDGVAVSNTIKYSIESYACSMQDSTDEALKELLFAMMKYGNAANTYIND